MNKAHVRLCYVPVEVTASAADALTRFFCPARGVKYIRFGYVPLLERTDLLIQAIFPYGKKDEQEKETVKTKKSQFS